MTAIEKLKCYLATQRVYDDATVWVAVVSKHLDKIEAEIDGLKQRIDTQQGVVNFRTSYLETERRTVEALQDENKILKGMLEKAQPFEAIWNEEEEKIWDSL